MQIAFSKEQISMMVALLHDEVIPTLHNHIASAVQREDFVTAKKLVRDLELRRDVFAKFNGAKYEMEKTGKW